MPDMNAMLNTRSGAQLDLRDPDPADIKLDDIAGSLWNSPVPNDAFLTVEAS